MSMKAHGLDIIGSSINITANNGAIATNGNTSLAVSGGTLGITSTGATTVTSSSTLSVSASSAINISGNSTFAISSDGYLSISSQDSMSIGVDQGDLTIGTTNAGRIYLTTGSSGLIYAISQMVVQTSSSTQSMQVVNMEPSSVNAHGFVASTMSTTADGIRCQGGNDGIRAIGVSGYGVRAEGSLSGSGGVIATGIGTGHGITGQGGSTDGYGLVATGGGINAGIWGYGGSGGGIGVGGQGTGSRPGVYAIGGPTSGGNGLIAVGGNAGGHGVVGTGTGSVGAGGDFTGSGSNGPGLRATAIGSAPGVTATGGDGESGSGVVGLVGRSGNQCAGIMGDGRADGGGYAIMAWGEQTSPERSAFRIVPQDTPSTAQIGDIYVTTSGVLKICTNATGPVWTTVGVQTP